MVNILTVDTVAKVRDSRAARKKERNFIDHFFLNGPIIVSGLEDVEEDEECKDVVSSSITFIARELFSLQ